MTERPAPDPGLTEVSAVCTDPAQSAGSRLHAAASNVAAIRLDEELGLVLRDRPALVGVRRLPVGHPAPDPTALTSPALTSPDPTGTDLIGTGARTR